MFPDCLSSKNDDRIEPFLDWSCGLVTQSPPPFQKRVVVRLWGEVLKLYLA
jgi:hypothetical protein